MVDTDTITSTAHFLSSGSIAAVIAILLAIIAALLVERQRIIKQIDILSDKFLKIQQDNNTIILQLQQDHTDKLYKSQDENIEFIRETINMYYQGNISLVQTLTEIKSVLSILQTNHSKN